MYNTCAGPILRSHINIPSLSSCLEYFLKGRCKKSIQSDFSKFLIHTFFFSSKRLFKKYFEQIKCLRSVVWDQYCTFGVQKSIVPLAGSGSRGLGAHIMKKWVILILRNECHKNSFKKEILIYWLLITLKEDINI